MTRRLGLPAGKLLEHRCTDAKSTSQKAFNIYPLIAYPRALALK